MRGCSLIRFAGCRGICQETGEETISVKAEAPSDLRVGLWVTGKNRKTRDGKGPPDRLFKLTLEMNLE